jgi:hypothetical protein
MDAVDAALVAFTGDKAALVPFNSKRMGWRRFLPRISPAL